MSLPSYISIVYHLTQYKYCAQLIKFYIFETPEWPPTVYTSTIQVLQIAY